jgi:DNA-binding NtrC family response regulator
VSNAIGTVVAHVNPHKPGPKPIHFRRNCGDIMTGKILIADDEESIRFTFSSFLKDAGYRVETAQTLSNCITLMQNERFDLLFLDITFGHDDGIEAIRGLKVLQPDCTIIIITGNLCHSTNSRALKSGAADCLVKPIRQASLLYIVKKIMAQKEAVPPHTGSIAQLQNTS